MSSARARVAALAVLLTPAAAPAQSFEACLAAVLEARPGQVVKVERKRTGTRERYEFDLRDRAGADWALVCEPGSARILEIEREVTTAGHPDFAAAARHDEFAARQAALARVEGVIREVEYEIESDGGATYEFDIVDADGVETKVEISAATLEVRERSVELWQVGLE